MTARAEQVACLPRMTTVPGSDCPAYAPVNGEMYALTSPVPSWLARLRATETPWHERPQGVAIALPPRPPEHAVNASMAADPAQRTPRPMFIRSTVRGGRFPHNTAGCFAL